MMIKRAGILAMLAILLIAAIGCEARLSMPTEVGAEAKADAYYYDETSGKVLTDLSERFDFKIEQWALNPVQDTGEERLFFSVCIKNKTKLSLKNFKCDILFDEDMLYLFTTGLTNYDQYQPVDFIPDVTANGASYSVDLSVNTDEQAAEFGADKNDLLNKVKNVTLKLRWDGGEETVTMDCGEIKKDHTKLLLSKDLIGIDVSAPEGSGGIRTMTLHYLQNGEEKTDELVDISSIGNSGYDSEAKDQAFTNSDEDADGITDYIVYREFWFPDMTLNHPEVPLWPTVYEYDLNKGFVIASSKHAGVFAQYSKILRNRLESDETEMSDNAKLSLKRLIAAAERITDGSFVPADSYLEMNYNELL